MDVMTNFEFLKIVLTALVSALVGSGVTWIMAVPKKRKAANEKLSARLDATEEGIRAILSAEIQAQYLRLCSPHRQYVKPYEKANASKLYNAYKRLGGNSYITKLYDQIMERPVCENSESEVNYD